MGIRGLYCVRELGDWCTAGIRVFLLLNLLFCDVLTECLVDHCAMEFTGKLRSEKVLMGSNVPYCFLIGRYEKCLKETSRGCRGNLKYHTLRTVVSTQQKTLNCSGILEGKDVNAESLSGASSSSQCHILYSHAGRGVSERLCTLFGDPHLRTFDGQFETCKTAGAWPLVDNSYIGIQVTNDPVPDDSRSPATGITKITVIVKALSGCTGQKVYEATSETLPAAFTDGTKGSGWPGNSFVDISIRSPDYHVVINLKYVAIKLFIRRHGNYLSLAVRIPEEVIQVKSPAETAQLCLSGCPSRQRVAYKEYLAAPHYFARKWTSTPPRMDRKKAIRLCRDAGVMDFYFDACVFDLVVSGVLSFRDAARDALGDARRLYSPQRFFETNRTDLSIYDHLAKQPPLTSSALPLTPCLALIILSLLHSLSLPACVFSMLGCCNEMIIRLVLFLMCVMQEDFIFVGSIMSF